MKKTVLLFIAMLSSLNACSVMYEQDPRSVSTEWLDSQLTSKIVRLSNKDPYANDLRVKAISYEGNIILLGQARSEEIKNSMLKAVSLMEGVKKVYDQIHIKQPISLSQISKDSWITTKVKSSLLTKKQLMDANIKVITEDGEVFLFGYVNQKQAEEATEIARNISGVVRVVQAWF